jgi:hypothetical protein
MSRAARSISLSLLIAACAEPVAAPLAPESEPELARASSPVISWKIPLATAGLGLHSDGKFSDGTYSVYTGGVCDVTTNLFNGDANSSGDATIRTLVKGSKCHRLFTVRYPDGYSEAIWSFNNVHRIQNSTYSIPIGSTVRRRFTINPAVVDSPSRCGRLIFGPNATTGAGSDSVLVSRLDAQTWQVRSDAAPNNRAHCEATGEVFEIPVSFLVVSSQPL